MGTPRPEIPTLKAERPLGATSAAFGTDGAGGVGPGVGSGPRAGVGSGWGWAPSGGGLRVGFGGWGLTLWGWERGAGGRHRAFVPGSGSIRGRQRGKHQRGAATKRPVRRGVLAGEASLTHQTRGGRG